MVREQGLGWKIVGLFLNYMFCTTPVIIQDKIWALA
jgi:hypothetical protein